MPEDKTQMPYGLWRSPITPAMVSRSLRFQDVQFSRKGELIWLEGRSDRSVLVARQGSAAHDLTSEESVSGGVGYGGGEFTVGSDAVYFVNRGNQLFRRSLGQGLPSPITPAFSSAASPALSPDEQWVVYVSSDGHDDYLALVDAAGQDWPVKLVRGSDFYMQPTWSTDGRQIAWVEWSHPNMPWDGTRVMVGTVDLNTKRMTETRQVGGGPKVPAALPLFSADGRWLSFIEGEGEWDKLVLLDLKSGERQVLVQGNGFNLTSPIWSQGVHTYGWSGDSSRIYYLRRYGVTAELWYAEIESGKHTKIDTTPYTSLMQLAVNPERTEVAFLANAPKVPPRVVTWDGTALQTAAFSSTESVPSDYLPEGRELHWQGPDGAIIHGIYYAPSNPDFSSEGLPPAIVHVHGGPTGGEAMGYRSEISYFTSRGYGYLVVNYRGSSGYGRSYQDALLGRWGDVDLEDVVSGARSIASQGLADPARLVVMGGSAGGYTVLNAMIHYPGVFKVGVCMFGVSNLFTLAVDTHKFEERYTISLVGDLPKDAQRYRDWSPIFHADKIRDPLAVFQGADDKVVVPSQSESIVKVLKQNGVPHVYKLYEGEGHGFRKIETIQDYLETVEKFFLDYLLF